MTGEYKELLRAISVARKFNEEAAHIIKDFEDCNLGYPMIQNLRVLCFNCEKIFETIADVEIGKARIRERSKFPDDAPIDVYNPYTLSYTNVLAVCPKCRKEAGI